LRFFSAFLRLVPEGDGDLVLRGPPDGDLALVPAERGGPHRHDAVAPLGTLAVLRLHAPWGALAHVVGDLVGSVQSEALSVLHHLREVLDQRLVRVGLASPWGHRAFQFGEVDLPRLAVVVVVVLRLSGRLRLVCHALTIAHRHKNALFFLLGEPNKAGV